MTTINPSIFNWSFSFFVEITAYVRSGPTSALIGLQYHNVTFILFPDIWLTCLLCCLYFLTPTIMHFAYGFQYVCAIKGVFLINVQVNPLQYALPKLVLNAQEMSSLLFFH